MRQRFYGRLAMTWFSTIRHCRAVILTILATAIIALKLAALVGATPAPVFGYDVITHQERSLV